jgi:hypothetical protein
MAWLGLAPDAIDRRVGYEDRPASADWSKDGQGNEQINGLQWGTNAYDRDVDRARAKGEAAQGRAALTVDQGQAGQSRGLQLNALEMLRRQGSGEAPSAAAAVAQRANQNAALAAGQRATGARSAGGALAALRNGAGAPLGANAANAGARAGENSQGQQGFAAGAGTLGGQDIGVATQDARLEAGQRAMNEQQQQFNERLAFDTRGAQADAQAEYTRQAYAKQAADRAYREAQTAANWNKLKLVGGIAAAAGTGGASLAASGIDTSGATPPRRYP